MDGSPLNKRSTSWASVSASGLAGGGARRADLGRFFFFAEDRSTSGESGAPARGSMPYSAIKFSSDACASCSTWSRPVSRGRPGPALRGRSLPRA